MINPDDFIRREEIKAYLSTLITRKSRIKQAVGILSFEDSREKAMLEQAEETYKVVIRELRMVLNDYNPIKP